MKKQEIVSVLKDLHKITGFRVSLHGADYREIAAFPEEKRRLCSLVHNCKEEFEECKNCDKNACIKALELKDTYIYKCRYGLTESVSPLYNFGTLTGFLMMGQVYEIGDTNKNILPLIEKLGISQSELDKATQDIPIVKADMIKAYVKIMTICAQYLTLSNAIQTEKPTISQLAKKYISENYTEKLVINDICENIGCSKSTLITQFKKEFGTTVNEYINDLRLENAIRLLKSGENSIGEIALTVGFSDQSYFSKVFSAKYGVPPSSYDKIDRQKGEFQ